MRKAHAEVCVDRHRKAGTVGAVRKGRAAPDIRIAEELHRIVHDLLTHGSGLRLFCCSRRVLFRLLLGLFRRDLGFFLFLRDSLRINGLHVCKVGGDVALAILGVHLVPAILLGDDVEGLPLTDEGNDIGIRARRGTHTQGLGRNHRLLRANGIGKALCVVAGCDVLLPNIPRDGTGRNLHPAVVICRLQNRRHAVCIELSDNLSVHRRIGADIDVIIDAGNRKGRIRLRALLTGGLFSLCRLLRTLLGHRLRGLLRGRIRAAFRGRCLC